MACTEEYPGNTCTTTNNNSNNITCLGCHHSTHTARVGVLAYLKHKHRRRQRRRQWRIIGACPTTLPVFLRGGTMWTRPQRVGRGLGARPVRRKLPRRERAQVPVHQIWMRHHLGMPVAVGTCSLQGQRITCTMAHLRAMDTTTLLLLPGSTATEVLLVTLTTATRIPRAWGRR